MKYKLIDNAEHRIPRATVFLERDGLGDVNIVIEGITVAFFNASGELWLVNFPAEDIGSLQRAGLKFVHAVNSLGETQKDTFTIKVV